MDDGLEKIKKTKEIVDILDDYNQLSHYISINDEVGMQKLMQKIGQRDIVEKYIYNEGKVNYPDTIQGNAMNCCKFLRWLLLSKGVDAIYRKLR